MAPKCQYLGMYTETQNKNNPKSLKIKKRKNRVN